jgi:hypothetical protein
MLKNSILDQRLTVNLNGAEKSNESPNEDQARLKQRNRQNPKERRNGLEISCKLQTKQ